MARNKLASFLGLSAEELYEIGVESKDDLYLDEGDVFTEPYYFFEVPEHTPREILEKKGWSVGEEVKIPIEELR